MEFKVQLNSRTDKGHQTLRRDRALQFLVSLVNAPMIEGPDREYELQQFQRLATRLRTLTAEHWPDLWGRPGDIEAQSIDRALLGLLHRTQEYLRKAWKADPYERDWFLFRARLWQYRHLIQPKMKEQREAVEAAVNAAERRDIDVRTLRSELNLFNEAIDRALDEPPPRTGFSDALGHLQQVADKLRKCPAPDCQQPYFIATRKGQEYCGARECVNYGQRKAKKKWWLEHRQATKRRRTS